MKTKEEWLNEIKNECSHGEACTSMLERISMIQNDALIGAMLPNELVEENDRLLAENSKLQTMLDRCSSWASLPETIISLKDELDRLRADNARLQSKCHEQGKGIMDAASRLKVLTDDLQRHKSALEKARELIRECRLVIDCFSESHDISAKNMIDNAVEHCDEFNAAINEVLK